MWISSREIGFGEDYVSRGIAIGDVDARWLARHDRFKHVGTGQLLPQ